MYGRTIGEQDLTFEASGGPAHGTLPCSGPETDSYWPIMAGRKVEGSFDGTTPELAVARKRTQRSGGAQHPDTLVLSVDGTEDAPESYEKYFASTRASAALRRRTIALPTKAPIFAFRLDERLLAAPYDAMIEAASSRAQAFACFSTGHRMCHCSNRRLPSA